MSDQRPITAEIIGTPCPTDGIAVAVGHAGGPAATIRIEYPMAMIDPHMVALAHRMVNR